MDETLAWRDEAEPTAEYRDLLLRRHEHELRALGEAAWLVDTVRGARVAIAKQVLFAVALLAWFLRWSPLGRAGELDRFLVALLPPVVLAASLVAVLLASAAGFRWLTRACRAPVFTPRLHGSLRVQIERLERVALLPFVPPVRVHAVASVMWPLAASLAVALVVSYGLHQGDGFASAHSPHDRVERPLLIAIAFVLLANALWLRSLYTLASCESQIAAGQAVHDFYFVRARNEVFALVLALPALGVFLALLPLMLALVGS